MGRDNAHGGAAVGWARTGGEVERKGTHTAGQGSGGDRTWADGWMNGARTWAAERIWGGVPLPSPLLRLTCGGWTGGAN